MFFRHNPADNASVIARAVTTACRQSGNSWPGPCCQPWLQTVLGGLLQFRVDLDQLEPIAPTLVRQALTTPAKRLELIELMLSVAMLCNPIPERLCDSVQHWACCLSVESTGLRLLRDLVANQPQRATADWFRLSWWGQKIGQEPERLALLSPVIPQAVHERINRGDHMLEMDPLPVIPCIGDMALQLGLTLKDTHDLQVLSIHDHKSRATACIPVQSLQRRHAVLQPALHHLQGRHPDDQKALREREIMHHRTRLQGMTPELQQGTIRSDLIDEKVPRRHADRPEMA